MNKLTILILLSLIGMGCKEFDPMYDGVHQELLTQQKFAYTEDLCHNETCMVTNVWYNHEIVYSQYSPITAKDSVFHADSLKAAMIFSNILKRNK